MKVINIFIIMYIKTIVFVLKILKKKAGTYPGRIALKCNKNIRDFIKVTGKIIVITGTNGKTTTTNMIAEILKKSGYQTISNKEGNNIHWGITSTLLKNCNIFGKIKCDYLVLETDEYWVPVIYAKNNLKIDTLIVLNFFRDQLDRAGETETVVLKIEDFIRQHPCQLILNGDDPNVSRIGLQNKKEYNYYYGANKLSSSYKISHDKTEGTFCPVCKETLTYEYYQYSHIGSFHCKKCKYGKIEKHTTLSDFHDNEFVANKETYKTNNTNLYHVYNLLAIISFSKIYKLENTIVKEVFQNYQAKNGRYQIFNIQEKEVILNLGKNPTGFNVVLKNIKQKKEKKELLIILNDKVNDGKDVSWIWDINLKELGGFNRIICSGTRAYDFAIAIKYSPYPENQIIVEPNIQKSVQETLKTKNKKYIISNYSPLTETKEYLEKLEKRG